jgi:hypothetical protein
MGDAQKPVGPPPPKWIDGSSGQTLAGLASALSFLATPFFSAEGAASSGNVAIQRQGANRVDTVQLRLNDLRLIIRSPVT